MLSKENITTEELVSIFEKYLPWLEIEEDMVLYSWFEQLGSKRQEILASFDRFVHEMEEMARAFNELSYYVQDDDELSELQSDTLYKKLSKYLEPYGFKGNIYAYC